MTVRISRNGVLLATSKNLRGAVVVFVFTDGATCRTDFGSATVAAEWVKNRKAKARGWSSADVKTFTTEEEA